MSSVLEPKNWKNPEVRGAMGTTLTFEFWDSDIHHPFCVDGETSMGRVSHSLRSPAIKKHYMHLITVTDCKFFVTTGRERIQGNCRGKVVSFLWGNRVQNPRFPMLHYLDKLRELIPNVPLYCETNGCIQLVHSIPGSFEEEEAVWSDYIDD